MAIASADRVRLAYVVEQSSGTTPTTPALQIVRLTGESLDVTRRTSFPASFEPTGTSWT